MTVAAITRNKSRAARLSRNDRQLACRVLEILDLPVSSGSINAAVEAIGIHDDLDVLFWAEFLARFLPKLALLKAREPEIEGRLFLLFQTLECADRAQFELRLTT